MYKRDRQTDRHTDTTWRLRPRLASRGKNDHVFCRLTQLKDETVTGKTARHISRTLSSAGKFMMVGLCYLITRCIFSCFHLDSYCCCNAIDWLYQFTMRVVEAESKWHAQLGRLQLHAYQQHSLAAWLYNRINIDNLILNEIGKNSWLLRSELAYGSKYHHDKLLHCMGLI